MLPNRNPLHRSHQPPPKTGSSSETQERTRINGGGGGQDGFDGFPSRDVSPIQHSKETAVDDGDREGERRTVDPRDATDRSDQVTRSLRSPSRPPLRPKAEDFVKGALWGGDEPSSLDQEGGRSS